MKGIANTKPPRLALAFFRWYCHPQLREEIEGDLLEQFHKRVEVYGIRKARRLFLKETILLCRPGIIGNSTHLMSKILPDMKKMQWLQLIALNLLVGLCIFLPFFPGRYDALVQVFSGIAQLIGFLGLVLVPIGILWLIQEIKKVAGGNAAVNNWGNGYYYALTALFICTLFSLFLSLAFLFSTGLTAAIIWLVVIGIGLYKVVPAVRRLKRPEKKIFNAAPLYLLSVPIIAFTLRSFLISPVSEYGRNYAIKQGQEAIVAIENYYDRYGNYPESLDYLHFTPKPSVMGIEEFLYERNGDAYNLSFVQWQHLGATREVVMYNKNDQHNVKGHFASYHAGQAHWRYYWLD